MNKLALYVTVTLAIAGFTLLWGFVWSVVVAWAWNMSMPHISSGRLPTIDYWQAYGVIVLASLVKSSATATAKD
jgi:uncharacterized membrane protein